MNVGTIAYATISGLGLLAKRFYDNGVVNRCLWLPHPRYKPHFDWYDTGDLFRFAEHREHFLDGLDALLLFENAFTRWDVVKEAKRRGIKIVMMPMYEWTPRPLPVEPDLYICPSALDYSLYRNEPSIQLTVPVDVKWRLRAKAEVFVHNAGHGGVGYRNGTPELIEAMKYVQSPIKLIIRSQRASQMSSLLEKARKQGLLDSQTNTVQTVMGEFADEDLWDEGDVFVFPEKYNGLSLPLQEAYASGMLVMATNRFPMNEWLPSEPLIPVKAYESKNIGSGTVQSAVLDPRMIAAQIDKWYGRDIRALSGTGQLWAEANSWERLKPKYLEAISSLFPYQVPA